jgi:DNA-directed RNA polymerase-4/5 subunit 2
MPRGNRASVRFGKVNLDKPNFWSGESGDGNGNEYNMLPRHTRLQNMAYSSRMKVNIHVQVNTIKPRVLVLFNLINGLGPY